MPVKYCIIHPSCVEYDMKDEEIRRPNAGLPKLLGMRLEEYVGSVQMCSTWNVESLNLLQSTTLRAMLSFCVAHIALLVF